MILRRLSNAGRGSGSLLNFRGLFFSNVYSIHLSNFVKNTEFCRARSCFPCNRDHHWMLDWRYSHCSWLGSPLAGESSENPWCYLLNYEIGVAVDAGFWRNWGTHFVLHLRPHCHHRGTCGTRTESIATCRRRTEGPVKEKKFCFCRSIVWTI